LLLLFSKVKLSQVKSSNGCGKQRGFISFGMVWAAQNSLMVKCNGRFICSNNSSWRKKNYSSLLTFFHSLSFLLVFFFMKWSLTKNVNWEKQVCGADKWLRRFANGNLKVLNFSFSIAQMNFQAMIMTTTMTTTRMKFQIIFSGKTMESKSKNGRNSHSSHREIRNTKIFCSMSFVLSYLFNYDLWLLWNDDLLFKDFPYLWELGQVFRSFFA